MSELKDELKTTIDAPWTNGEEEFTGMLGFIQQAKKQLLYFQAQKDTEHIRQDIAGYDEILKSNKEENARNFMEFKNELRLSGNRLYGNNSLIVQELKDRGRWVWDS